MINKIITIIEAEEKHVESLAELHVRSWQKVYKNIVSQEVLSLFTIEKRIEAFSEYIHNKTRDIYVCMLDETVVGFVSLGKCRDSDTVNTGEIKAIYLDPEYFRRGIGSKLAMWAIDYLKQAGFRKIVLWVFKENFSSRKFYESIGFKPDGSEKLNDKCRILTVRYIIDTP